ncbi:Ger(x)C family spore germination protein [Cohnella sp. 56]|uniref:Ger(x)C family spore germination protein n=1 Tax=Cohnella sp. 56 TaxID=3113722 RepID=UPI0030E8E2B3
MRAAKGIGILLIAAMLGGCTDQKVLEKIGFTRTIFIDSADGDKDKINVTISIPKTNQSESIVYSNVARTFKQAKVYFDMQNDRRVVLGQLRQILFGGNLARKGVWPHLESIFRDPSVGIRTHVILLEGDIDKLSTRKYTQGGTMGEYLDNLVRTDPTSRGVYDTSIHTFLRDYYDDGIEPLANIIKGTANGLMVDGVALFVGDRYVAKVPSDDAMYFAMLRANLKYGTLVMEEVDTAKESVPASLSNVVSKRSIRIKSVPDRRSGKPAEAVLELKIRGSLLEYYGHESLNVAANQRSLEVAMEKYVGGRCERLIRLMQAAHSDAIGFGQRVRNKMDYQSWKRLNWSEEFPRADIKVSIDLDIKDFGSLAES